MDRSKPSRPMVHKDVAFYELDEAGRIVAGPYCERCWLKDGAKVLYEAIEGPRVVLCPRCSATHEVPPGVIFPRI